MGHDVYFTYVGLYESHLKQIFIALCGHTFVDILNTISLA